jgi:hypothetical protein
LRVEGRFGIARPLKSSGDRPRAKIRSAAASRAFAQPAYRKGRVEVWKPGNKICDLGVISKVNPCLGRTLASTPVVVGAPRFFIQRHQRCGLGSQANASGCCNEDFALNGVTATRLVSMYQWQRAVCRQWSYVILGSVSLREKMRPAPAQNGLFTTDKARAKMGRAYPGMAKES